MIMRWKCEICNSIVEADVPPEICPHCQKKCVWVDNSNYVPDDENK